MVGIIDFPDGRIEHADQLRSPLSDSIFFIVPGKCTECVGFHEKPQCAAICPEDCCVKDPENAETKEELLKKKEFLH